MDHWRRWRVALSEVVAPREPRELLIEAIRTKDERRLVELASATGLEVGDVDATACSLGLPVLHAACAQDLAEGVVALVEHRGARVDAKLAADGPSGKAGDEPLHVCARAGGGRAAAALVREVVRVLFG